MYSSGFRVSGLGKLKVCCLGFGFWGFRALGFVGFVGFRKHTFGSQGGHKG